MKSLLLTLLVLGTISATAKQARQPQEYIPGSKCGLTDNWTELPESTTTYDLSRSTRRVKSMNKVVKQQLIASANALTEDKNTPQITDAAQAAKILREGSEGEELYVERTDFKGKKYSVISYYGGGNHTGYIFAWGSSKILAEISDDDIQCIKK
jgi:hypothetical protein